jgi:hypothetical protein
MMKNLDYDTLPCFWCHEEVLKWEWDRGMCYLCRDLQEKNNPFEEIMYLIRDKLENILLNDDVTSWDGVISNSKYKLKVSLKDES